MRFPQPRGAVCIVLMQGGSRGFCGGHNGKYESLFAAFPPQFEAKQWKVGVWQQLNAPPADGGAQLLGFAAPPQFFCIVSRRTNNSPRSRLWVHTFDKWCLKMLN